MIRSLSPEETSAPAASLADIEAATKRYADARAALSEIVGELNAEIEAAKRRRLAAIKRFVATCAERQAALAALIEAAPALFAKPRTHVFHGVKVGFQKGKGGIEFDDADDVVARIHRLYPDAHDLERLIRVKETPNKEALAELPAAELKRLGCAIVAAGDQVVIKPVDGEVDRIVNALLKDATEA
jgi:phage host-nuclease inhibitor protein Gam